MTLDELLDLYRSRFEDCLPGDTVLKAAWCQRTMCELRELEPGARPMPSRLNTQQAAKRIGKCAKTVANMCGRGDFRTAVKDGSIWTISEEEIAEREANLANPN